MKVSTLEFMLLCSIIFLAVVFNSYFLEYIGIQYVSEGGASLFKIHFYSYVGLLTFSLFFFRVRLNGIRNVLSSLFSVWLIFLGAIIYTICYSLIKSGTAGSAYLIDTLLVPTLLLPIVFSLSEKNKQIVLKILAVILIFNSLVAVYEYAVSKTLIDYEFEKFGYYFRSTAFFSHPLNNALITVSLCPLVLLSLKRISPVVMLAFFVAAVFAFGARTAFAVFVLSSPVMLWFVFFRSDRSSLSNPFLSFVKFYSIFLFAFSTLLASVFYFDLGNRIFDNLNFDGSAMTRFDLFYVFDFMSFNEVLFGARQELFDNLSLYIDNKIIENFVILWLVTYGVFGSLPLIASFYYLMARLWKSANFLQGISIFVFCLVSISNNSLATKSSALLFFFIAFSSSYSSQNQENRPLANRKAFRY